MIVGALVSGWFFAQAGSTAGRSAARVASDFRTAADADDWRAASVTGADSVLEAGERAYSIRPDGRATALDLTAP